ncbi:MAG TPA: methyltransferase domain-containing protein [Gemmatimonadota bacterium]|nr:methyltransferase domain-containing protein [Gemmatimonadota bacterium]
MPERVSAEAIAGAEAYESLHVPALFEEWVGHVLDAADVQGGQNVVDVACGTGVLARGALPRVGPRGSVTGVDPAPGMLAVAARLAPSIDWREGVAEALPLPDSSVDAVMSQFGMMFFTDRDGSAREMHRVLRDGGRFAVATWDVLENQPAYSIEVGLLDRLAGREAGDALRAPFVLGDAEAVRAIFERAGFVDVQSRTRVGEGRFPSVRTMVEADLRGWLPVMGVHLPEETIDVILREAEREMGHLQAGGEAVFESPAHVIHGVKA